MCGSYVIKSRQWPGERDWEQEVTSQLWKSFRWYFSSSCCAIIYPDDDEKSVKFKRAVRTKPSVPLRRVRSERPIKRSQDEPRSEFIKWDENHTFGTFIRIPVQMFNINTWVWRENVSEHFLNPSSGFVQKHENQTSAVDASVRICTGQTFNAVELLIQGC